MRNYAAYIGSYSYTGKAKGITILDVDMERGNFKRRTEVEVDSASDIVVSSDRHILYVVEDCGVVAFCVLPDGGLVRVSSKKVNGMQPHHICVDQKDKYLYASGYHDGKLTILHLNPDGAVEPIVDKVCYKGLDSVAERSLRAHTTCSEPTHDMRFMMSADPGIDQVSIYRFTEGSGEVRFMDVIRATHGSSPYFFTFSKGNHFLYLFFDTANATDMYRYMVSEDRGIPEFTKLQTVYTTGDNMPGSLDTAIYMTFTTHDHYIFMDNAGDNSVTLFSRNAETGLFTTELSLPISGGYPEGVAMFPDGQHIVSMDHESGTLSLFKVDYEKKLTAMNTNEIPVSQPNCCVIMPVEEDAQMAGNMFGTLFHMSTFGESHGTALNAVIDGCPAGLPLSAEEIQTCLNRGEPGQSVFTTLRKEADTYEILSGVFGGKTLGTPIAVLMWSKDQHSVGYQAIWDCYRPGHADFGFDRKLGFRDPRDGGESSGWETIDRVIGDTITAKLLVEFDTHAFTYASAVDTIEAVTFDEATCAKNLLDMPDPEATARAATHLREVMQARDSLGGTMGCHVTGMFPGLGEPVFDKLGAELAKAVMSIDAVKGVGSGDGFGMSTRCDSENNNAFCPGQGGTEEKSNHAGGMLGGVSGGSDILLRAAVKATPSVDSPQETVNRSGELITIGIQGRHDPAVVPRVAIVVKSMVNLTLTDLLLRNSVSTVEKLKRAAGRA